MKLSRSINYVLILVGGIVAIYAKAKTEQNEYILIGGIVILMVGIYGLSRTIPSKNEREHKAEIDAENIRKDADENEIKQ